MFEFRKVEKGDPLIDEVYRLRYKVYIEEWGFEDPEDHPTGIEKDLFDDTSVHFIAMREADKSVIGTVRVIYNSAFGFPMEKHSKITSDLTGYDRNLFGEISRLAVSKEYRKRATDRGIYDGEIPPDINFNQLMEDRRKNDNAIIIGLYKCVYHESVERGLTHLYAVMAKGLYLLLKRIGITFDPIGPEVNYHGLRTPYIADIQENIRLLAVKNSDLYREFMS